MDKDLSHNTAKHDITVVYPFLLISCKDRYSVAQKMLTVWQIFQVCPRLQKVFKTDIFSNRNMGCIINILLYQLFKNISDRIFIDHVEVDRTR